LGRLEASIGFHRKRHYLTQVSTVLLSAIITVVAGLKSLLSTDFASNMVLTLGAISTVLAAWGSFFSPREMWLLDAELYGDLRALNSSTLKGKCFTPKDGKWKSLSETSEVKRWRATIFA
jgi:hypothetical protein